MINQLRVALAAFILLTVITGVVYPLLITVIGQVIFPYQANGSLIIQDGQVTGSTLIGQSINDPAYFWSRPSAVNYMQGSTPEALISSGATNYGWTNATLSEQIEERSAAIREAHNLNADATIPSDLLFASASGLDPHISPEAAALQIDRVAEARGLDSSQVRDLVEQYTESPQFGLFGQPRVNVLLLNLALDGLQ
jgi:K+-transporting ATPase ATPase C chain